MRLPRRLPWSSLTELEQVCSWIYADENDWDSNVLAINRLSAWRAITPLPHALESTLSLLVVITQDNSAHAQGMQLSLRQSYSSAIIRLVNGLVDPLQFGAYARSIASIANQLGFPSWLVELRHAATHEELPSLELLREAARESMNWLLHNYFLPTINPSSASEIYTAPLRPLAPILKQYKSLLKITTRDASLRSQYKLAITSVMKDIERWIAEVKVAANVAAGPLDWEHSVSRTILDAGELDAKEKWTLEKLCDALLEKSALVPLSKQKRTFPTESFTPPEFSVLLWSPLLQHLHSLHSDFLIVLCDCIVLALVEGTDVKSSLVEGQPDHSYDMCLARWAMWSIETWERDDSRTDFDLRKEVTTNLMQALGRSVVESPRSMKAATALLQTICAGNPQLEMALSALLRFSKAVTTSKWNPEDITIMNQRLSSLTSVNTTSDSQNAPCPSLQPTLPAVTNEKLIPGWQLLDESSGWRACPIGVHYATTMTS